MGINLSGVEKAKLNRSNFIVSPLAGSTGSGKALYHNPKTGQELMLPGSVEDIAWYTLKGFRIGSAPTHLVYTPDADPMDDPRYNKNASKSTQSESIEKEQLPLF